ncbi:hypothetical protein MGG_15778 [Pyricularia oryzae 70-15]|uniref:Uncharacterized protein n=1 Tax=Pyricularia oryzae (strain 70-15 / ATCC MYA-4617 / FGSC 8958) TaxID=242507 RepID=G4MW69_PYRO7|nr:uncharacterized protein MGG_15778 [Pyricularia oryzae 70-15]EHA55029.1 hypothetical protein MGG_15778 [Pyricularia oryzae 70-15]KAI7924684.1 hypothetical protein M9X92_003702 [Pyricularia oryzae]KAI7928027.1 hypothetical protein M0657_002868 [Pyricularia oryzae]
MVELSLEAPKGLILAILSVRKCPCSKVPRTHERIDSKHRTVGGWKKEIVCRHSAPPEPNPGPGRNLSM